MREIKFRGKRLENGQWVYGYPYCWHSKRTAGRLKAFIHEVTFQDGLKTLDAQLEVDPNTVGQYTGLKDKNGKEGYESDFFKDKHGIVYKVEHDENGWIFIGGDVGYRPSEFLTNVPYSLNGEFIGNIYENSKLLEEINAKG